MTCNWNCVVGSTKYRHGQAENQSVRFLSTFLFLILQSMDCYSFHFIIQLCNILCITWNAKKSTLKYVVRMRSHVVTVQAAQTFLHLHDILFCICFLKSYIPVVLHKRGPLIFLWPLKCSHRVICVFAFHQITSETINPTSSCVHVREQNQIRGIFKIQELKLLIVCSHVILLKPNPESSHQFVSLLHWLWKPKKAVMTLYHASTKQYVV